MFGHPRPRVGDLGFRDHPRHRTGRAGPYDAYRTVPADRESPAFPAYACEMFHVYVLTDENGSWPLLSLHELPWQGLRTPPLTLLPLGDFDLLDDALGCAADFGAATRGRLVEEALEIPHGGPTAAENPG